MTMPNETPPTAPSGEAKLPVLRCDRCGDTRALNSIVELGMVHHCPIGGLGAYQIHTEQAPDEADAKMEAEFTDNEADRWGWDDEQVEDAVNFARMFKRQRDEARDDAQRGWAASFDNAHLLADAQADNARLTSELDRVRPDAERWRAVEANGWTVGVNTFGGPRPVETKRPIEYALNRFELAVVGFHALMRAKKDAATGTEDRALDALLDTAREAYSAARADVLREGK